MALHCQMRRSMWWIQHQVCTVMKSCTSGDQRRARRWRSTASRLMGACASPHIIYPPPSTRGLWSRAMITGGGTHGHKNGLLLR